jgi:hypothetical protein
MCNTWYRLIWSIICRCWCNDHRSWKRYRFPSLVSAELHIRHNGAKKKLQLKHKNSLFTLQTFHYSYYWWSQSLLNRWPRCSSAETQVCHRSYIIAARNNQIRACSLHSDLLPHYRILSTKLLNQGF